MPSVSFISRNTQSRCSTSIWLEQAGQEGQPLLLIQLPPTPTPSALRPVGYAAHRRARSSSHGNTRVSCSASWEYTHDTPAGEK